MRTYRTAGILLAAATSLALFASSASAATAAPSTRAIVIVSGGAAISPFTAPGEICRSGYSAGSTDTFMRTYFVKRGYRVFTSPAMGGRGKVLEQPGKAGPFRNCAKALPDYMTVDSTGDIGLAGEHLASFLEHLQTTYGIREIDLVAHSMGGLYSRAAIRHLSETGSTLKFRSLNTIGTPWQGAYLANSTDPANPYAVCDGFPVCTAVLDAFLPHAPVLLVELKYAYMRAFNKFYEGDLDHIPVTMVGGNAFTKVGGLSTTWPNDGIVAIDSALGKKVSNAVIKHRRCFLLQGGTHSLYMSRVAKLADSTGITWNKTVGAVINQAIKGSASAMTTPNRIGCPAVG
ncbi:MAG: alpha/beta hydrolase [Actinomycetota bacterium]